MARTIQCELCDETVETTSNRQRFCPNCSKINDREYMREYISNYRKTEKGTVKFSELAFRRSRKIHKQKNVIETFTMIEWFDMLNDTLGVCPMCNTFVGKTNLTMDHIYPVSKAKPGRVYTYKDIQPLCRACNSRKADKTPEELK